MDKQNIDPELHDLIETPDEGPDVPDLELPSGDATGGVASLMRQLETDALIEELTETCVPSRVSVTHEQPLPSGMGTGADLDATTIDWSEIESQIRNIAETARDGDDLQAALGAVTPIDPDADEGWREKARKIDRTFLKRAIEGADDNEFADTARLLRMFENA